MQYNLCMRYFLSTLFLIILFFGVSYPCFSEESLPSKAEIIALYSANKLEDAYQLIAKIPEPERDAEMWLLLANITQDYGKLDDAVLLLQKSIEKDSTYYKPYYNLANIYFEKNKIVSAIENNQLAIKYNKEFPYAYYNLGCCYLKDAEFRKAKTNFMKAISLKNNEPSFYYNLALTYKKMGNEKQAKKFFDVYNSLKKD